MKKATLIICYFLCCYTAFGQIISVDKTVVLSGKIVDSETNQPLEYATISLQRIDQNKIIGTTTDENGLFKIAINADIYHIKIDFLSFKSYELRSKVLANDLDLGVVSLKLDNTLEEVEVVADKKLVDHKINKKIYNASADIANKGGNGLDVLSNTPSVRVDDEGNINVRGSSATILINGKPQFNIDNNTDILKSLPSNSIDKVEIISRSAKYGAEGGGAILNIITKKSKIDSFSGSFEAYTGIPDNHGLSTFLNKKTDKINLFSTISYINENRIRTIDIDQPLLNLFQDGEEDRIRNSLLFNVGSDFYLNDENTLSTSFLINTNNKNSIYNIAANDFDRETNDTDDILKLEANIGYKVKLDTLGQELSFDFRYENTASDTKNDVIETQNTPTATILQQLFKDQQLNNFLAQVDYTLPFNENTNLELGYKGTFRNYENNYKVEQFDVFSNDFITIDNLDDTFKYNENVHAFYGLYNATHNKFSYAIGLRTEISNITIEEENNNTSVTRNYTDLFPSLTLAYEINDATFISLNYSRSIDRPSIPQISPLLSFSNQRFQSVGNQNLNPYYTNYFELLFDKSFEKLSLASALFVNYQKDQFLSVIQNTGQFTTNSDEIFRRTFINSGNNNIIGLDLDITYTPFKGLRLNGYVSPYRQELTNTIDNAYNNTNTVWFAEGSALISLNNGLEFRLAHQYQSPIKNGLTELRRIHFSNVTISKDLFKENGTLTFKAVDIFNSKRFITESFEANTETIYSAFYQNQYSLAFTYRFNQKRKSKKDRSKDINKDELEDKQDKKL